MIRNANLIDVPRMVELGAAMHAESRFATLPWDGQKVFNLICTLIDHSDGLALVAERDGVVIGGFLGAAYEHFFSSAKVSSDFALFVEPGRRGGITAARLLRAYVEWAKSRGVALIQSGITTGVDVDKSSRLFEAVGFVPVGPLFDYQGN